MERKCERDNAGTPSEKTLIVDASRRYTSYLILYLIIPDYYFKAPKVVVARVREN